MDEGKDIGQAFGGVDDGPGTRVIMKRPQSLHFLRQANVVS